MSKEFYPGQMHFVPQIAYEKDPVLESISKFIDDYALDQRLAYINDFSTKRGYTPSTYIRIHMLRQFKNLASYNKTISELEIRRAYRKFCNIDNKSQVPCPGSLSNFRKKIGDDEIRIINEIFIETVRAQVNLCELSVFIVDASDLESPTSLKVIDIEIDPQTGKKTKIFHDRDARFGKRANKKNKSKTFLGYKKHTVSLLLPDENISIPLCSLIAPADVHEINIVEELIKYAKSLDIPVKILSADLGYYDMERAKKLQEEEDVTIVTQIKSNTVLPDDVDERCAPLCDEGLGMKWDEFDKNTNFHRFLCPAENPSQCLHYPVCSLEKMISLDTHPVIFGAIPLSATLHDLTSDGRKYIESVFGRQKNNEGLKDLTLKGKKNFQFISAIADGVNAINYLYRKEKKERREKCLAIQQRRNSSLSNIEEKGAA